MAIAVILELFAIFWAIASFCACCCRPYFLHVLPVVAVITTILLAAAMITFGVNHDIQTSNSNNVNKMNDVSYSFWIGVAATLVALTAAIIGSLTACLGDVCC